jgi:hypothetical protein
MTGTISIEQNYEKKFHQVTADLKGYRINQLQGMQEYNSKLVVEYLNSKMREGYLKPASRASTIDRLSRLSLFNDNKSFRKITTEDIFSYIDTIRRNETDDPMHKWIGRESMEIMRTIFYKDFSCIFFNTWYAKNEIYTGFPENLESLRLPPLICH